MQALPIYEYFDTGNIIIKLRKTLLDKVYKNVGITRSDYDEHTPETYIRNTRKI